MECKNTSISVHRQAAFTMIEMLVASSLALALAAVIATLTYHCSYSFVSMANYTDMNKQSQLALDKLSKEIRQARGLIAYSTNSITLLDADGVSFKLTYNPSARTLTKLAGGNTTTYLTECNALNFFVYQHTIISNTFACYNTANVTNARVIQMTWKCSRDIRGKKATSDSVQSAEIVIRNH
jgi:hypothetical protein